MRRNVWEWTSDLYDKLDDLRVVRGGSWLIDDPYNLRAAVRIGDVPTNRWSNYGFRCVVSRP